jgi:membrane protease YdiL (CAAX protease family)
MTTPIAVSVLFVVVVISVLRCWPSVLTEDKSVQSWVWRAPSLYVVSAPAVADYANLSDINTDLLLTVVGTSLLVGVGEELVFRGASINALRDAGMREDRVALWSSVIFGGAHITNLFTEVNRALTGSATRPVLAELSRFHADSRAP